MADRSAIIPSLGGPWAVGAGSYYLFESRGLFFTESRDYILVMSGFILQGWLIQLVFERGMAGSDPSTRSGWPVVLEVSLHSRALSKRGIQIEIVTVLGYLYYLEFCTFQSGVVHSHFVCRNTIFRCSSLWVFLMFVASATMPKKFRSKCLRGQQRQFKKVHSGLPNAYR